MIQLTRINHVPLVVNSDLIEHIESTPDTILTMTNGQKLVIRESVEQVVRAVIEFRRSVLSGPAICVDQTAASDVLPAPPLNPREPVDPFVLKSGSERYS
jgi:flagellar protein FlbD